MFMFPPAKIKVFTRYFAFARNFNRKSVVASCNFGSFLLGVELFCFVLFCFAIVVIIIIIIIIIIITIIVYLRMSLGLLEYFYLYHQYM